MLRWTLFFSATLLLIEPISAQEDPLRARVDDDAKAAWTRERITPAAKSFDGEFLRRVYLDLVGVVPSHDETKRFLAAPNRTKLIDALLDDPRFARRQADIWDQVLFGRHPPGGDATRKRDDFKKWLAERFAKNEPFDQIARKLLLAEEEGPEMFFVQYRNQPEEATVAVTRVFLGTQLQCARCHDHPYESWTQKDFYGMAGFFVRLVVVDAGPKKYKIGEKNTGEVLFTGSVKEQKPGQKGEPVKPKFLGGDELPEPAPLKNAKEADMKAGKNLPKPAFSRKEKIADWIVAAENPYFAKALANRVWAQFMGRGIIHPVDDLSGKNLPSHPELLSAIAKHLVDTKFDLKDLIRELVNSETYQLSGVGPNKDASPTWYERARVRPLTSEELLASFKTATQFPADGFKGSGEPTEYFLRYFGEPTDGQGYFQGSLSEHLFLNNAPYFRTMSQPRKGNLADTLLTMKGTSEEKVDHLFLSMLNRSPSQVERDRFVSHLQGDAKMMPALIEEAVWVLMSCSEFRFNH